MLIFKWNRSTLWLLSICEAILDLEACKVATYRSSEMTVSSFVTVRFVPQLGSKASQVDKELEIANQKAHAAKWSHAKRRKRKEQAQTLLAESRGSVCPSH